MSKFVSPTLHGFSPSTVIALLLVCCWVSFNVNVYLKLIVTAVTHVVAITLALLCHLFPCLLQLCVIIITYTHDCIARNYSRVEKACTCVCVLMHVLWLSAVKTQGTHSILQVIGCAMLSLRIVSPWHGLKLTKLVPFWSLHLETLLYETSGP